MKARIIVFAGLLSALGGTAHAQSAWGDERFIPTFAIEGGATDQELRVASAEGELSDSRSRSVGRLALGLEYRLREFRSNVELVGQTSVGIGYRWQAGSWPVNLRQEILTRFRFASWLAMNVGLATGFEIDTARLPFSYWEIGVPISLTLRYVELHYYPHATLPLSSEETVVFAGTQQQGSALAITPLYFVLRFRIEALGF